MASNERKRSHNLTLEDLVREKPTHFEFHAVMKLLELMYDEHIPVAEGMSPDKETVRFRHHLSMSFAGTDIHNIVLPPKEAGVPVLLEENFFGLGGAQGPLPMTLTQKILSQMDIKNFAMRDFLDIFNHRLLSILHRVRKSYWVGLDSRLPEESMAGKILSSFFGVHADFNTETLPLRTMLSLAVCFWEKPRNKEQLRRVLSVFLRMPVTVKGFTGGWRFADPEDQSVLGRRLCSLGQDALLGQRMWDTSYLLDITLQAPSLERYEQLAPGTDLYKAVCQLSQAFLGNTQQVRFNVIWSDSSAPKSHLGKCRIGYKAWLHRSSNNVTDNQTYVMGR